MFIDQFLWVFYGELNIKIKIFIKVQYLITYCIG